MATTAAKKSTIEISDDGGATWSVLGGIDDIGDFSPIKDVADKTYYGTSGAKDKMVLLADLKMSPKGDRLKTDAGQIKVKAAYDNETSVKLRYLFDGVSGYAVAGIVPAYKVGGAVNGKVKFDFTFDATALPVDV